MNRMPEIPSRAQPSEEQLRSFAALLERHAVQVPEVHVANSAGLLAAPKLPLTGSAVRPGLRWNRTRKAKKGSFSARAR